MHRPRIDLNSHRSCSASSKKPLFNIFVVATIVTLDNLPWWRCSRPCLVRKLLLRSIITIRSRELTFGTLSRQHVKATKWSMRLQGLNAALMTNWQAGSLSSKISSNSNFKELKRKKRLWYYMISRIKQAHLLLFNGMEDGRKKTKTDFGIHN